MSYSKWEYRLKYTVIIGVLWLLSSRMNELVYKYVQHEFVIGQIGQVVFKLLIKRVAVAMVNKTVVAYPLSQQVVPPLRWPASLLKITWQKQGFECLCKSTSYFPIRSGYLFQMDFYVRRSSSSRYPWDSGRLTNTPSDNIRCCKIRPSSTTCTLFWCKGSLRKGSLGVPVYVDVIVMHGRLN
jgi:hypothetical protein